MGSHGRSLAPKKQHFDARSVSSFDSDSHSKTVEDHDTQRPGLYQYNSFATETSYSSPQYKQYPAAYVSDSRQAQSPYAPLDARPGTADTEEASHHDDVIRQHYPNETVSKWKRPWFCYLVSLVQVAVFIGQCVHGWKLTGSPITIRPSFNPMIGPSTYNSINMGARFVSCMKEITNITDIVTGWPCPNATTSSGLTACTLSELCGNGVKAGATPNQWWRFIVPIFLHAGIVHIVFNLLVQLRLGAQIEMDLGAHILVPVYFAAGIGGFLFGGNFAGDGVTSTGASGAIFSIISLSLLDLLYHWGQIQAPRKGLLMLLADVIISFFLGLLPGVDNFSHIGGFIIGMLLGIALMRSPDSLARNKTPYDMVNEVQLSSIGTSNTNIRSDPKEHDRRTFLQQRSPWWWAYNVLRLICFALTILVFALLVKNFYNEDPPKCTWCKYLSCIPVSNWCSLGDLTTTTTSS